MLDTDDRYYTAQELADLFKVSTATVHRMSKRGELPCPTRLSRTVLRWSKKRIDAMLEERPSYVPTRTTAGDLANFASNSGR